MPIDYYYYPGMDPLYWLFFGGALVLSLAAQAMVKYAFGRYSTVGNSRNLSGAEAAAMMLSAEGVGDVRIVRQNSGFLSDNFNPSDRTISLSPDVYDGRSVAAVGVACHEAGHALQHARGYAPMAFRSLLIPVANLGNALGVPLIILGMVMGWLGLAKFGLFLFAAIFVFQLVTLPVELDASARSKKALAEHGIVRYGEETRGVAAVLNAAALTYVAAAVGTLLTILYHAMRLGLLGGRSSRD